MAEQFEYVAVEIPRSAAKGQRLDNLVSEALNRVAQHGYRYVGSLEPTGLSGPFAVMEREVR